MGLFRKYFAAGGLSGCHANTEATDTTGCDSAEDKSMTRATFLKKTKQKTSIFLLFLAREAPTAKVQAGRWRAGEQEQWKGLPGFIDFPVLGVVFRSSWIGMCEVLVECRGSVVVTEVKT